MDPAAAAHPPITSAAEISDEPQQREEHEEEQQQQQQQPQKPESSSSHGSRPPPPVPAKPVLLLPEAPYPTSRMMQSPPSNMTFNYGDRPEGGTSAMPGLPRGGEGSFMDDPRRRATTGSERVYGRMKASNSARRSAIDWVVPVEERRYTVAERLKPTLDHALRQRNKLKKRALFSKWAVNVAVGLQVFLGALTTGVAAIQLTGKQLGIATTVLGILTTLAGAFLGRIRSTEEPETSLIRARDLDSFTRRCEAFVLDHGHEAGNDDVNHYRLEFEALLGISSGASASPSTAPKSEAKPRQAIPA